MKEQVALIISQWSGDLHSGLCSISLVGSADSTASDLINDALSLRRAQNVKTLINDMLIQLKLAATPITVEADGERNLAVKTGDLVNEWRNRRVEMTLNCSTAISP